MKTKVIKSLAAVLLIVLTLNVGVNAQPGQRMDNNGPRFEKMYNNLPNITDQQKTQLAELRTSQMQKMLDFKNQIGELQAKQKTLMSAKNADMGAINANIDAISQLKTQMMKERATHIQKVRSILTDEQRVIFDSHKGNRGMKGMHGKGMGRGKGRNRNCNI